MNTANPSAIVACHIKSMTAKEAKKAGFVPLTHYYDPDDFWMMENAIQTLEQGRIDYCTVPCGASRSVWREKKGASDWKKKARERKRAGNFDF